MKILRIPLDLIDEDTNQPRTYYDNSSILELSENIKTVGLLSPIKVRSLENGRFMIVFGHRRYKACKILNMDTIPAIIADNANDIDYYFEQVAENIQRQNFTPIEEAKAFRKLIDKDNKQILQISVMLGKSSQYIERKLKLLEFGEEVKELIVSTKGVVKNQLSEEQVLPIIDVPIHFRDKLAVKIANEELMPSDVKKIKELFTASEDEIDIATKSRYLKSPNEKLLNDYHDLIKYREKKKREEESNRKIFPVNEAFISDSNQDDRVYYRIPIHQKLQKLFMQLPGENRLSGSVLRELNMMKIEERTEFLETLDFLIQNLEDHLTHWTSIREELKKANIKLVK